MATANPSFSPPKDLTRCGICNDIINEPKTLHCLHTFCLECMREWSKPSRESVTDPIDDCKEEWNPEWSTESSPECSTDWNQGWSKPQSVTCPIVDCKKTTPMPASGVDGLPGNVFVSSLIERRSVSISILIIY